MKDFIIYPHKGYLNTEFKFQVSDEKISKVRFESECNTLLSLLNTNISIHSKTIEAPGVYNVFVNDEKSPRDTVVVENAYKFGGSKLSHAYLSPMSAHAFLVMLDRMYIYDYLNNICWVENGLVPDSIEALTDELVLFKSERKVENGEETTNSTFYSIFSVKDKQISISFNEYIAHTDTYLIYKDSTEQKIGVLFYCMETVFLIEADKFVFDKAKECIYFTRQKDNKIYQTSNLEQWITRQLCLHAYTDGVEICYDDCTIKDEANPLTAECHNPQYGTFMNFCGTHYAIYNHKIIDLQSGNESKIASLGIVSIDTNSYKSIEENLEEICESNDDITKIARRKDVFFTSEHISISTYPTENNLYWIEKQVSSCYTGYKYKHKVVHSCLNAIYPIHTKFGDLTKIHLSPIVYAKIEDNEWLSIKADNVLFYIDNDHNIAYSFKEKESDIIVTEKREYPGRKLYEQVVKTWQWEMVSKNVVIVENSGKYSIGIWDDSSERYVIEDAMDNFIDKSSYGNAMFSADGTGVLIKDKISKRFQWMDKQGKLQDIPFEDSSFISKGINGYLPLIAFDKCRKPVFVDPVTSNMIEPAYLRDYVFTSPDKSLFADNNHRNHIKYKDEINNVYISHDEYCRMIDVYDKPTNYYNLPKERQDEIKDEISKNRSKITLDNLPFFQSNDFFSSECNLSALEIKRMSLEERIDALSKAMWFRITDTFLKEEQYILIKDKSANIIHEIYIGQPLWFLNYVSFSYDNRYVAISGRYPDNTGKGGLLYIYDLKNQVESFDSNALQISYNAVWIAVFARQGRIGSYTSEPKMRLLQTEDGSYNVTKTVDDRNYLTFSKTGKYIALSEQGYIRYDKNPLLWGHQPSCNIHIVQDDDEEIGCYNDFGSEKTRNNKYTSGLSGVALRAETVASVSFSSDEKQYLAISNDGVVVIRNL